MSFSATEAAFEGFRIIRQRPILALIWGGLYGLMLLALYGFGSSQIAALVGALEAIEGQASVDPQAGMMLFGQYLALLVWAMPLGMLVSTVLGTAIVRTVLRPEDKTAGYPRIGMTELRVFLAVAIVTFGLAAVFLVLGMGLAAISRAAVVMEQPALFLVVVLGVLGVIALAFWINIRFSLVVPMTVDRDRIDLRGAFRATKGHFWPLLGMGVIAVLMSMLVAVLGSVIGAAFELVVGGLDGLAEYEGESALTIFTAMWPAILVTVIIGGILNALQMAIIAAPFAAAWRDLRGGKSD